MLPGPTLLAAISAIVEHALNRALELDPAGREALMQALSGPVQFDVTAPVALTYTLARAGDRLGDRAERLVPGLERAMRRQREAFDLRASRLRVEPISRDIARRRQDLDRLGARLAALGNDRLRNAAERLAAVSRLHETLGYEATLERGYAVVRDGDGAVLTRAAQADAAEALEIQFADGRITVGAGSATPPEGGSGGPGGARRSGKPASRNRDAGKPEQGSLF